MRILVLSDTHGKYFKALNIIKFHSDIKHIFFLGDKTEDIEIIKQQIPDRNYYIVSGNCDFSSAYKSQDIVTIENTRIFYCHGHRYGVKYSLEHLKNAAISNNCTLALFGHTHRCVTVYDNGLYLVNPGSVSLSREGFNSYAIIDITKSSILPSILAADKV